MAERSKTADAVLKGVLIAQVLVGGGFVGFWLWTGKATIPRHGGGWLDLDRIQDPFTYWFLLVAISFALVAFPLRYLYQGPPKR